MGKDLSMTKFHSNLDINKGITYANINELLSKVMWGSNI